MHFSAVLFVAVVGLAAGHFDVHHHAQPYAFGYSIKDHHGEQHREESGDGGNGVKGSYGFTDDRGVHRQVHYVADHAGFRAEVKTNEPGTANQNPAAVKMISSAHNGHNLGYAGVGAGLGYAGVGAGLGYAGVGAGLGYGAGYGLGYAGVGAGLGYGAGYGLGYAGAGAVYGLGYAGGLGGGYGYNYAAPLHGGYVSVYDSRHAYV